MENFIKRILLCMISLSLILMSIDVMYLKVYASEPIAEVMDESDSEIEEETEKAVSLVDSEDILIENLSAEDIPQEVLLFFNELGYSEEEILSMLKDLLVIEEQKRKEYADALEESSSYQEKLYEYESRYNDSGSHGSHKTEFVVSKENVGDYNKKVIDFLVTLYEENDFVSGEVSNFKASVIDDFSNLGIKELKTVKRARKFLNFTEDTFSKAFGLSDGITARENVIKATGMVDNAVDGAKTGSKFAKGCGSVFGKISGALTIQQICGDFTDLLNDNMHNQKDNMAELERNLLLADCGISSMALGAMLIGAELCPPLAAAAVIIGIATAFVHSKTFADAANNANNSLEFWTNILISLGFKRRTPRGVGCYKPNIYFYNALGYDIEVLMLQPELITKSIPEYGSGWNVEVVDNESLIRTKDGAEYGYLFYESVTNRSLFQEKEGFFITRENRGELFKELLTSYGFDEKETKDFIEFWDNKLEKDKDYIMYPQYTETVNKAMPIRINPVPKNLVRLWFAFEENQGQSYEETEVLPFTHDDYTMIEWGGMIFK